MTKIRTHNGPHPARQAVLPRNAGDRICLAAFTIGLIWALLPKGESADGFRFVQQAWDVGHLVLFFLASHLIFVYRPQVAEKHLLKQILFLIGATLLAGGAVEFLQNFIPNRTPSFSDLAIDVSGVIAYISFRHRKKIGGYILLHLAAICLICSIIWPPIRSFTDETIARRQFPLLAGFETPLETSRFEAKASEFHITREKAFAGTHSLRLDLSTQHYSGIWLHYMPRNWKNFSFLEFAVYNPQKQSMYLNVRVNDEQNWSDHYDGKFLLKSAVWTPVKISLADLRNAPRDRQLDLTRIRRLGLYVVRLQEPLTLYVDEIRLEK